MTSTDVVSEPMRRRRATSAMTRSSSSGMSCSFAVLQFSAQE
ncbi:hypothetical protein FHR80_003195 [Cellulomonas cellasea]|uniref:Uncharacterized protein n=1 Tax=Cellulomonas cellasea TaxID=43670 RepID=A0A7W4YD27_9CELL|nr:hypothetical protein [Cellulomonas cellasea]